jgi:mono/diheme cytochrome c family protein
MLVMAAAFAFLALVALASNTTAARAAGRQDPQAPAGGKTVWDGVYTDEQTRRGGSLSQASCVVCHGDELTGSDLAPALLGPDFIAVWSGRTVGDLFEKIQTTMPADAAGTLKPQQSADLVAYILKLNDFPPGTTELGSDLELLKQILVRKEK